MSIFRGCRQSDLAGMGTVIAALALVVASPPLESGDGDSSAAVAAGGARPNVVLILTDNQGHWTLGCYGNKDIRTPNIDGLAMGGTLFTNAFANNPVCSPTRASLLTGLMPSQHGVHRYLGAGGAQIGPGAYNTLAEFDTIPSLLAGEGYTCGLSGKWHLGDNLRPQEGFTFWITKPHGHSPGFYDQEVIENGRIRREKRHLTDLWTEKGVEFIRRHQDGPFFLLLAYNGPYGLGSAMREATRSRHADTYAGAGLPCFPRRAPHAWNHEYGKWVGDVGVMRKYASEISAIDDGVGRILETLRELSLEECTLVIFTADQGLAGGHGGFWGMGDHTRPLTLFDWTLHVPLILSQPGRVAAGHRVDRLVSNVDIFPTLLEVLGISRGSDGQPTPPGRSFVRALHGEALENWEDVIFAEFENVRAVRTRRWKYVERFRESPNELYDVETDPEEMRNLIDDQEHARVRERLAERLRDHFVRVAEPGWDLWSGGTSKTGLIMGRLFENPGPAPKPPGVRSSNRQR